ncbi:Outer membrane protein assembly factor BamD [Beijerinckiaceae bacterium RH AL1]|jgi:outer membrane protein assembly factor BamD|nr:outer membrane protein assembly factor BamD [Beijerinckiaceae bacterium]VVB43694.1 Outer membrane protein assembly factor BamD [Beijerinckiaceae bacterium RH AL8]VVB43711.1 Outer membrane protein assembly factor BamD [Beijerinckiaceae bacterium RH CH11]VVC53965.1 Outer membrane protein assembly factor BamD [Beijerinckiaceae bacterium RH AL1]
MSLPLARRPVVTRSLCAAIALAAFLPSVAARADFLDSINPMNWWKDEKYAPKPINDPPPSKLYAKGIKDMQERDFETSAKVFSTLEKAYPYSQYQRKGLIMTTYAQYENKSYTDAIGSAKRYLGLYPNSPDSAYVTYLEAMAYYDQIPDINHDLVQAENAANAFNEIVTKYPNSEYAADARYKMGIARDQLAGKELEVGRWYLKQGNYTGAINRFRVVLAKYQTTRQVEEALERLTEAYLAMGLPQEAQTAAAVLGHNYPDSPWYKEAYAKLQSSGGLRPNEDKGSWISKVFKGAKIG